MCYSVAGCAVLPLDGNVLHVNGRLIEEEGRVLESGDQILIGNTIIDYERDGDGIKSLMLESHMFSKETALNDLPPLSTSQVNSLKKIFDVIDADGSGKISRFELNHIPQNVWDAIGTLLRKPGDTKRIKMDKNTLDIVFESIDKDGR